MDKNISNIVTEAQKAYKNQNYIKSYTLYKSLYKKYNLLAAVPNLIDVASISIKKNLLRNRGLKFKLISNLIDFGLKKNCTSALANELVYLRLKLLRDFKKFYEFNDLYNSLNNELLNNIFVQFEYMHYLLEIEKYEEAERVLERIKSSKVKYYENLDIFYFDKIFFKEINNTDYDLKHNVLKYKESIKTEFSYIVTVTGSYDLFISEMTEFIQSLKKTSTDYLLSLLIHDASDYEISVISDYMDNFNIDNYSIHFESSDFLNLAIIQTKSYYTARRYIFLGDMMQKYNKTTFLFDADSIIRKDLKEYVRQNKSYDMSLLIKNEIRYFNLTITANQAMFNNTDNSKIFLNFYKKYSNYLLKKKKLRWNVDQIVLYICFIIINRFFKAKIHNNSENDHKNKNCFFYHTFHNKYLL